MDNSSLFEYKFRAEWPIHVSDFKKEFVHQYEDMKIRPMLIKFSDGYRQVVDQEVEFKSFKSINEIRECMEKIVDSHVMIESLNYIDKYDGTRWYR